ncbi:TPA: NinF family protein [Klebsiella aerogenes]|nr:NinF family protein [Klebsiella aerogenes]
MFQLSITRLICGICAGSEPGQGGKVLSSNQIQSYEQQSIRRTLCAGCTKELSDGEVHCCEECASLAIAYRDPNGFMTEEDDG